MEIILVRHAIPQRRETVDGPADPELSADGHRQAALAAEYMASEPIDALYCSPMRRARQTAEPFARVLGRAATPLDGVAEYDRNSNEYVPIEELKATSDPRWQAMLDGQWPPSDEPEEAFVARVISTVEGLIEAHPGQKVVVVCHGGVINAYAAHVLGLDLGRRRSFFYPNYTSIHRFAAARSGERSIVTLNETSHLRGSGLPIGLFQR
ncbi:MAG: histidine phosphatase family protein [Acidimicrobiia bacterium]